MLRFKNTTGYIRKEISNIRIYEKVKWIYDEPTWNAAGKSWQFISSSLNYTKYSFCIIITNQLAVFSSIETWELILQLYDDVKSRRCVCHGQFSGRILKQGDSDL